MEADARSILIVEDEQGIREITSEYLRRQNYRVTEAANAIEALEKIAAHTAPPDLVVTDVIMPGMSGAEMAHRLRLRWPTLKIIFITACTEESLLHYGLVLSEILLKKPFRLHELGGKVREVLAAAACADSSAVEK